MGYVVCGVHGSRCCWRCDACPKCSGKFNRVGKGDYCPDCTVWLKANGYVWSEFYKNYVTPEVAADGEKMKIDMIRQEALEQKLLADGEAVRCAAVNTDTPQGKMVKVWFKQAKKPDIAFLMAENTYHALPIMEPYTPDNYREFGELTPTEA